MSLPDTLPHDVIDFIIALLLPLILPTVPDPAAARALALGLLTAHQPADERDLQLAAEAVAFSIRTMAAFAEAADPATPPERRDAASRRATSLSRSGLQVQRALAALQRERRAARMAPPPFSVLPMPEDPYAGASMVTPPDEAPAPAPPREVAAAPAARPQPQPQPTPVLDVPQAEEQLRRAEKLLALMQAHHNGAPPPGSKAEADIEAQQRVVDQAYVALAEAAMRATQAAAGPAPGAYLNGG
jgi:hypothetical protein